MTLLAPLLLLAGVVALGLPLAAHLRGRRSPRTVAFAGRRFLAPTGEVLSQRRRLRDRPLLGLRLLLLGLVALALSRPVSRHASEFAVLGEPHDAILLIDGSRSMGLRPGEGEKTLYEATLPVATALAAALPAGSRLGLIGSDPSLPVVEPSADPEVALRALRGAIAPAGGEPRPGSWRLGERVAAAASLGANRASSAGGAGGAIRAPSKKNRTRVIYALGDRTAGGLASLPGVAGPEVAVIPVPVDGSEAKSPDAWASEEEKEEKEEKKEKGEKKEKNPVHLGIAAATWAPAPEIDPRALRIRAEIAAYGGERGQGGAQELRRAQLTLEIDGEALAQAEVEVAVGDIAGAELTYTASDGEPRPAVLSLRPVDTAGAPDPLPSDDRRALWLLTEPRLRVTLVNGDPSDLRTHDEVFFLATALAEGDAGRAQIALRSLAPDQLAAAARERGGAALGEVDVLVLANVPAPAEDVVEVLQSRVAEGMGLWWTVGERVDARLYNQRFAELLPLLLREAVVAGTAPGRSGATGEGFAPADFAHPIFRGEGGDVGLLGARARRIFLVEPDPRRSHAVALTYTSGAPALLTRDVGRGRVALLTTSIDRDWGDLPLRPGFVPLALRTVAYLGADAGERDTRELVVGEPWSSSLPGPLTVVAPGGERWPLVADEEGVSRFTETFAPGHYRVLRPDGDTPLRFTVHVDPAESVTTPLAFARPELAGDRVFTAALVPRWRPLFGLIALALALEALLRGRGLWWRRRR